MVGKMKFVQFAIILSGLIIFSSFQFSHAQYMDTEENQSSPDWLEKVKSLLQDHLETELIPNQNISEDSIKTRISKSGEDVLPPRYHIRILYDLLDNNNTKHMDLIYFVDFGPDWRTLDNAKLEKVYDMEYKPPKKIVISLGIEQSGYVYWEIQNVMCRQGFEKVIKNTDDSPACVKPESIPKLMERDWLKHENGVHQNYQLFDESFQEKLSDLLEK